MRMRLTVLILAMAAFSAAAQQPKPDAQIAAMKKLDYMVGDWQGEGWIEMGGPRIAFRGGEKIQRKLNGVALLVEGAFFAENGTPVHTTLAVMSYDPKGQKYDFATWLAQGTTGNHELKLIDNGWYWEIQPPGAGTIRFTMTLQDGQWVEVGERSTDGTTWKKFFEMKLKK